MTVTNTTSNRGYQLPDEGNQLADDVLRLISALSAIDVDVAAILVSIANRALLVHQHVISDTAGLQAALDSKQDESEKGNANGYAALDATGKVPAGQLPSALFGAMSYQGTWNANTNTPTIPAASSANKGQYYKVATAGATNVSGVTDWQIGDWIVSNGASWDKIDNTDQVVSVAGLQGVISAAALKTALAITLADIPGTTRLGTVCQTITDWNAAIDNGWYMGSNVANAPDTGWWFGQTIQHNNIWHQQDIFAFTSMTAADSKHYRRYQTNSAWTGWFRVLDNIAELDARYLGIGGTAARATAANTLLQSGTGSAMTFNWSGQGGQPSWVWGGEDGANMYVYNPANFNVYSVGGWTQATISAQIETRGQAWAQWGITSGNAAQPLGGLGTYAWLCSAANNTTFTFGSNYAGSNLRYAGDTSQPAMSPSGTAPAGTWKAMGYAASGSSTLAATLFLRVA
ncbi:pyocin knob domain-containing protein [Mesorhizobium sp. Cs1299R1N3]|uniref:pyocin knob domain-containing protein n=1 Tax=Mesorhizobium sp. Cs1299R1N3 TaxID=3015173 RepID=UPI00301C1EBE